MTKPLILIAEDNDVDILLYKRIFKKELPEFKIVFVDNVDDGITYLKKAIENKMFPNLLILDVKLINSNGLDLLKFVKESKSFSHIPAVMLSSSDRESDQLKAKKLGCNAYYEKPKNYIDFKLKIPQIILLWIKTYKE